MISHRLPLVSYLLTSSFKAVPDLKTGAFLALIMIDLPVCGLRPLRSARSRTSKLPKPSNWTFSPSAKNSEILSKIYSTASFERTLL